MSVADVSIMDVGHGSCTIIHQQLETVIIDCGAKGAGLINYLRDRKIDRIKNVLISHADQDHIGGLLTLILNDEISVDEVSLNGDGTKHTKIWDDLVKVLDADDRLRKIKFNVSISSGDAPVSVGNFVVHTIGPSKFLVGKGVGGKDRNDRKITTNSISASFLVSYGDLQLVYVSGDIDKISLDEIIHTGASIMAEVLVFPHHGGDIGEGDVSEFASELLHTTNAKTVIFSIGRNRFKNPRPEVILALKTVANDIKIACTQLSKNCCSKLPTKPAEHLHSYYANGRYRNECCGGTFVISIDADGVSYWPNYDSHTNFISTNVENALCKK